MPRTKTTKNNVTNIDDGVKTEIKKKRSWIPNKQEHFGEENVQPRDNSRYLRYALTSWDLPPIDISDEKQVEKRIKEYFQFCMDNDRKPNIVGMANWLGVSRDTLHSWRRGEYRAGAHSDLITKAVDMMEELWVDYMMNGKVNPGSGIFIGKNHYSYRDVVDIVAVNGNPLGEDADQKALEQKVDGIVLDEDDVTVE